MRTHWICKVEYARLYRETSLFVLPVAAGLIADFGLQAVINMASSLYLMLTKGTTLPFISDGGSSLRALALAMGMFLALTSRRCSRRNRLSDIPSASTSGRIPQRPNWGIRNRDPAANGFLPRRIENRGQAVLERRV